MVAEVPAKKPGPAGESRIVRTGLLKDKNPKNESGKRQQEEIGILTECEGRVAGPMDPAGEILVFRCCLPTGQATSLLASQVWSFTATFWIIASRISAHPFRVHDPVSMSNGRFGSSVLEAGCPDGKLAW